MGFKVDLQALLAVAGRQRTEDAVGIPDREDGDARRSLKRPRCAIANGLTCRDLAHLQDPPGKMDHRREGIDARPPRPAAIEGNAWTHEVVAIRSPEQNAG